VERHKVIFYKDDLSAFLSILPHLKTFAATTFGNILSFGFVQVKVRITQIHCEGKRVHKFRSKTDGLTKVDLMGKSTLRSLKDFTIFFIIPRVRMHFIHPGKYLNLS